MTLASSAALIVATMDLKMVQAVTSAMRAVDGKGCKRGLAIHPEPDHGRRVFDPEPRFEPRPVYHPTPRFEPRLTVHPKPFEQPRPSATPMEPERPGRKLCPFPPPWRVHFWEIPIPPRPQVKVIERRTEIISKGSLIDLFI